MHSEREVALLNRVRGFLGSCERPPSIFNVEKSFRARFEMEFFTLERFDFNTGRPEVLETVYEPNTFLSPAGYKYVFWAAFPFFCRWRDRARGIDFTEVLMRLPFVDGKIGEFGNYSSEEKVVFWDAYSYLEDDLNFDYIKPDDMKELSERLLEDTRPRNVL